MTLASESFSFRRASARLLPVLLAAVASTAAAGPADPNHRFERIGFSVGNVAAVVQVPGEMRAIVVTKNGEIHRVAGDRLVDELMGSFTVSQTCDGDGVLDAAWDTQTNSALFVTYIQASPRKFVIARLDVTGRTVSAPQQLYSFPVGASVGCNNLGGGIAMSADGKLLVGVGDMGNGPGAGQGSVITGKILRLNATMPGGPAADNPNASSPVFCLGVRNPTRMALDTISGNVWFIDVGPSMNDELNWINGGSINYAWPRASGPFGTNGFRDPAFTWATSINPTGVVANTGSNFGPAWVGDAIVSGANGTLHRVHPVDLVAFPPVTTGSQIFTPGTGEPGQLTTLFSNADGYAYASTASGEIFRLRSNAGPIGEPSDASSIVPMLVRKQSGGGLEIVAERETALDKYGFYPGTLTTFYSHFNVASPLPASSACVDTTGATQGCLTGDASTTSAWSRIQLTPAQVSAMPDAAYFVLSGLNTRAETAVGQASTGQTRPGGIQTFGCPCPAGTTDGVMLDQCAPNFTLNTALEGVGNNIGPVSWNDFDCDVILMAISAEWCGPCQAAAVDAEELRVIYGDRGFTPIDIIPESIDGSAATPATIARWTADYGLNFPVLMDENYFEWDRWWGGGDGRCNGWPHIFLFDREGVMTDAWCGFAEAAIRAAVDREVNR